MFVSGKVRTLQLQMMKNSGQSAGAILPLMESLLANPAAFSVTEVTDTALLTSSQTGADPIVDSILLPAVGMGAAIAIPAVVKARGAAEQAKTANEARQILMGRMQALIENENKAPSLEEVARDYLNGMDVSQFEVTDAWSNAEASDGEVIVLRQREAENGRRVIGFADGHVEVVED